MQISISVLFRFLPSRTRCLPRVFCTALLLNAFAINVCAQQYSYLRGSRAQTPKSESSEIFFEGYISKMVFKFAGGELASMIYYGGIEYDRHSSRFSSTRAVRFWDRPAQVLHAHSTYVFEVLPVDLVRQPTHTDYWGDPLGPGRKTNPGIAISPLGFRWIWRDEKALRPFWTVKLGEALFAEKAFGTNASYENFTVNSAIGFQARLTATTDFRLGCAYQHVSNAYTNADPGLDTIGPSFGIVYHLPASSKW
jgi:hypothetical protein